MRATETGTMLALMLAMAAPCAAKSPMEGRRPPVWEPETQTPVPLDALSEVPDTAAGCLLVGYHILKDGTVAQARVMRGAYTGNVQAQAQEAFIGRVLATVADWRFRSKQDKALSVFEQETVGFAPVEGQRTSVIGEDVQDPRVRRECGKVDLAEWGERNALPVDSPGVVRDGRILVPSPDEPGVFWVPMGGYTPPHYPRPAFEKSEQGCVVVGMVVGSDGKPDQFRIMKSRSNRRGSAAKVLEDAAVYGASQWRFSPGPDNLQRMPALLQIPITFSIDSAKGVDCGIMDIRSEIHSEP